MWRKIGCSEQKGYRLKGRQAVWEAGCGTEASYRGEQGQERQATRVARGGEAGCGEADIGTAGQAAVSRH